MKFIKVLVTFLKALWRRSKDPTDVPFDVELRRKFICFSCPHLNKKEIRCNACGCKIRSKTIWATESCPKKLWPKYDKQFKSKNPKG
jgi:hypothetical protein|tara:strand:- start:955 stop:1215 length:261 start_codon:yes stop_codon:yes gene_type:complete